MSLASRDPYADGTLIVNDGGTTIRTVDGSNNNLANLAYGQADTAFNHLAPREFEDGIQSPAGVANDAQDNQLTDINGAPVVRQAIPIFTAADQTQLIARGFTVVANTPGLTNDDTAPFAWTDPQDRPSTRAISNSLSTLGQGESLPNANGINAFIWSFGQFVNHTTDLAEKGREEPNTNRVGSLNFPIDIPEDDPDFPLTIPPTNGVSIQADGGLEFDFERDAFELGTGVPGANPQPGEAINIITTWLDLSSVYGSSDTVATAVREFSGGRLRVFSNDTSSYKDDLKPVDTEQLTGGGAFGGFGFLAGDARVNENDGLASQHTLWMRNHNRLARELSRFHGDWTDEQIFQRARQLNIAQFQNIVFYEWLPLLAGTPTAYNGYDPSVDPTISDEFAVGALRIGHTQVNDSLQSIDASGNITTINVFNSFGSPNISTGIDVDNILRGQGRTVTEDVDTNIVFSCLPGEAPRPTP